MFKYSDNKVLFKNSDRECVYDVNNVYYTLFIEPVKLFYGFYRENYDELEKFIWNFVETNCDDWWRGSDKTIIEIFSKFKKELNSFTMADPLLGPAATTYIVVVFDRIISYFKKNAIKTWKFINGRVYYMMNSECYYSTNNDIRFIGSDVKGKFIKEFSEKARLNINDMSVSSFFKTHSSEA